MVGYNPEEKKGARTFSGRIWIEPINGMCFFFAQIIAQILIGYGEQTLITSGLKSSTIFFTYRSGNGAKWYLLFM
jgi:hypothetical protein